MLRLSLVAMVALTVLIAVGLRWREERVGSTGRLGLVARGKRSVNRWITAAALAAGATMVVLGGLHWVRIWIG